MKNFFSLVNFVFGLLALLVSIGIVRDASHRLAYAGVGLFAFAVAAACLWLAKESVAPRADSLP